MFIAGKDAPPGGLSRIMRCVHATHACARVLPRPTLHPLLPALLAPSSAQHLASPVPPPPRLQQAP
eukprot:5662666-Prorocentrum_lima.AAC.1